MSDKPDVAALTDEQCDAIRSVIYEWAWGTVEHERALIRAGRASLQANVPADVAALIARLLEHNVTTVSNYPAEAWKDMRQAAAALQSQADDMALRDDERVTLLRRARAAEARVAELERERDALRAWFDASTKPHDLVDAAIAARKP